MEFGIISWFDALAGNIIRAAIVLLIAVNGAFVLGVLRSRSRAFVDRWTPRVLLTDAALALTLVGAPVANMAVGLVGKGAELLMRAPTAVVAADGK